MRTLAFLGILALVSVNTGCGSSSTNSTTKAADGFWESALLGTGAGSSVFNFITKFSVNSSGSLNVTYFSFLTTGPCFPLTGETVSGAFNVNAGGTSPTADFQFNVQAADSALAMTGTATGTTDSSGNTAWQSATGNWTLTGAGSCSGSGTFTMTPK